MSVLRISDWPEDVKLTGFSREEFTKFGGLDSPTYKDTKALYEVRNAQGEIIQIAGVWYISLTGRVPELWTVLCEPFARNLRESLRECYLGKLRVMEDFPFLQTQVLETYREGNRFCEVMDWKLRGTEERADGLLYNVYRE